MAALRRFFSGAVENGLLEAFLKSPSAEAHRDRLLAGEELRVILLAAEEIGYRSAGWYSC